MESKETILKLRPRSLRLACLLAITLVIALGWTLYQCAEIRVEREARDNLMFIDRMKGDQLNIWHRQRLSDIAFIVRNPVNDHLGIKFQVQHFGYFLTGCRSV